RLMQRPAENLALDRLEQQLRGLRIDTVAADGLARAVAERSEIVRPYRAAVIRENPGLAAYREVAGVAHRVDSRVHPRQERGRGASRTLISRIGDEAQAVGCIEARAGAHALRTVIDEAERCIAGTAPELEYLPRGQGNST